MKRFFFHICLLVILFSVRGFGQEIKRIVAPVDLRLHHNSFPSQSWGAYIFSSLASANVMGINWVELHYRANILVQLNNAEIGQYSANLFLQGHKLTGTINFREFVIDSVLDPDILEGRLELYDGDKLLVSRPWLLAFKTGRVDMHLPDNIQVDDSNLVAKLIVDKYAYSDEKYNSYLQSVETINYYYAFAEILSEMLEKYDQEPLHRSQPTSRLLLAREEIRRVNKYANQYHFQDKLNLQIDDPKNLLQLTNSSLRLERRAVTLSHLNSSSTIQGVVADRKAFSEGYPKLSETYIVKSTQHQPHIAAGFGKVSRIISDEESKMLLVLADSAYDVFNRLDKKNLHQNIYDGFVVLADSALESDQNVACLDLLYNASIIEKWFDDVSESSDYLSLYVDALEGLMTAYLKVATMAYRNGSVKMADRYYANAKQVYKQHDEVIMGKSIATEAFLEFIDVQVQWSHKLIEEEKYYDAIKAINKVNSIGDENAIAVVHIGFDSLYDAGHSGVFNWKMDSILVLLDSNSLGNALEKMEEAKLYADKNLASDKFGVQSLFTDPAQQIIDHYYAKGIQLFKTPHPEDALEYLIKARSIQNEYLQINDPELDSLINSAAVPVILKLVKKGEFDTWANRMESANALYVKALDLQNVYEQMDNPKVVEAMITFKSNIDKRICVNLSNHLFSIEKKAENRIGNKNYFEAGEFVEEALSLISSNPECGIEGEELNQLYLEYQPVFEYAQKYEQIKLAYANGSFSEVVDLFAPLETLYIDEEIGTFGIEMPELENFVISKNSSELTNAAADYFIEKGNFNEAFTYLKLLRANGVDYKQTKTLQQKIGNGLSQTDKISGGDPKKLVVKYTSGDRWYRFFKSAYLNRPAILSILN